MSKYDRKYQDHVVTAKEVLKARENFFTNSHLKLNTRMKQGFLWIDLKMKLIIEKHGEK